MKTTAVINLKGGVAKTITAANLAHILTTVFGKRVLIIDNDKQGNTSKMFGVHGYEQYTLSEILTHQCDIEETIRHTRYENLDVIPANMTLLKANMAVMMDSTRPQQTRIKKALLKVAERYDYCIIDNAPDINISVINALVACDDVIIPIKIDQFAFDGLDQLTEQIEQTKEDLNPNIRLTGCVITSYVNNEVNKQGKQWLIENHYPIFNTHIRRTEKVDESTFARVPIIEYSRRCGAARDYLRFAKEYLDKTMLSDLDNGQGADHE